MNNTNNSNIYTQADMDNAYMDIDAIFKERNEKREKIKEDRKKQQIIDAVTTEIDKQNPHFGWINPQTGTQLSENEYYKMIGKPNPTETQNKADTIMKKSTGRPQVPYRLTKFIDEVKEYKKQVIATVLVTAVLLTPLVKGIKTSIKFNEMINNMKNSLQESNLVKLDQSGRTLTITESPSEFIERLNISKNDNIRLFLLSLSISSNDFDTILRHLGYYSGYNGYINQLGYYTDQYSSASEQYNKAYTEKVKNIINDLIDNPEKYDNYIQMYPELQFIYGDQNTYVTENGEIFTLNESSGRSH